MPYSVSTQGNVLLVDVDEAFGQMLKQVLGADYRLQQVSSAGLAIAKFDAEPIDAVLLNLDTSPQEDRKHDFRTLLRSASDRPVSLPVIAYSWEGRGTKALEAFREGAFDMLDQPIDIQQLKFALERARRRLVLVQELADMQKLVGTNRIEGLLGNSKVMERVSEVAYKVAEVDTSVLITGESGTGKGVLARAIHQMSSRSAKPFVAFSACAFPESLIEDELFGHERAAFTGATQARRGRFEEAHEGTIFLDEIGDLALPLQTKLLRVLQERTLERLGSNVSRPVNVRIICATSRNLEKMVEQGTFREDLYFRISVVNIPMPPLRERKEDIPLLGGYFLRKFAKEHNKGARNFSPGFMSALTRHAWPGNVRELQNVVECSLVLANGSESLGVEDLPNGLREFAASDPASLTLFHEAVQGFKKELVRSALQRHSGNKLKAAKELGISRCYLHRMLNSFGMASADVTNDATNEDVAGEEEAEKDVKVPMRGESQPDKRTPTLRIA